MTNKNKAVVSVIGKDAVGILAKVTEVCSEANVNITDISQTILSERIFAMTMLADLSDSRVEFGKFSDDLRALGASLGLEIRVMNEDIFNSTHRI